MAPLLLSSSRAYGIPCVDADLMDELSTTQILS